MAGPHPSFLDRADDAGVLKHLEVAHEGGQGHFVRAVQFADTGGARGEPFDDRAARGVGHGAEEAVKLVSHMAKYKVEWVAMSS